MNQDMDYLIRTVFGEAGAEPAAGQQAVAAVILNRARQSGMSIPDVVLARDQFEPWNNPQARARMEALTPNSPEYARIAMTIAPVVGGRDPTGGADHFYSPTAQSALGRAAPDWDNGKGQDIGRHRFFRLGWKGGGGGSARAKADIPSGEDIFGFGSDEQLQGGSGSDMSGADIFGLSDAGDTLEKPQGGAPAAPGDQGGGSSGEDIFAAAQPAKPAQFQFRGFVNSKTGEAYPQAQQDAYAKLAAADKLDPNAKEGSEAFPRALTDDVTVDDVEPGTWYVDLDGNVARRSSQRDAHADDSWLSTAKDLALSVAQPVAYSLRPDAGQDARAEAIRQGTASGFLWGGKNEILAGLQSIPDLVKTGTDGAMPAYLRNLAELDAKDANLREAFPIAHGAGATVGALTSGFVAPELKGADWLAKTGRAAANTGIGAVSGFVSTDGSMEDRAKGAAIGGGLGLGLTPVPGLVGRMFGAGPAKTELTGKAGLEAEEALKALGTSTAELSDEGRWALRSLIQDGAEPKDAARIAMAQDLPAPVPMTTGQVTGLPTDQLDFNLALRGAAGEKAAADAQAFQASQQDALRLNLARIAGGMADGKPPGWNAGGEAVSGVLNQARDTAKKGVDDAYDLARSYQDDAILPKYDAAALAGQLMKRVGDYDELRIPHVSRELDRIVRLSLDDANLKDLFASRSRLSALSASSDVIEAKAAKEAVKGFDAFVSDALSAELFHGNPEAVDLWRKAIKSRREFGEIFQAGDLVERLTEKTGYGGATRLKVDPGEAGNLIFGRSELGSVGRANLYSDLTKIKGMVDKETWNSLRAEHFVRVAQRGEGATEGTGAQLFSGSKFLKAWNDAKAKDMRLIQTLYTPDEIATINRFASVAERVTNPIKGGDNSSNTAVAAMKAMGGFLGSLTKGFFVTQPIIKQIEEAVARGAAKSAMKGTPRSTTGYRSYYAPAEAGSYVGSLISSEKKP